MRRIHLSLEEALKRESESVLTIYSTRQDNSLLFPDLPLDRWFRNYNKALIKYNKVAVEDILDYINCKYVIELELPYEPETNSYGWVYFYAQEPEDSAKLDQYLSKGKYVYVLTNEAYPNYVKIGKAVNPQSRVKQINGAGTVSEWKLHWAIPVTDDYRVENLTHRRLEQFRRDSDQGSSREFFEVSSSVAIQTVTELARDYYNGEPMFY